MNHPIRPKGEFLRRVGRTILPIAVPVQTETAPPVATGCTSALAFSAEELEESQILNCGSPSRVGPTDRSSRVSRLPAFGLRDFLFPDTVIQV